MSASVFPARAGMSRSRTAFTPAFTGVPRASGDEPNELDISDFKGECSPRERG